jgi:hypothetical protein
MAFGQHVYAVTFELPREERLTTIFSTAAAPAKAFNIAAQSACG